MAAKKARQRISYVLELPNSQPGGHRLGVNGLAIDKTNAILYSGGRDGVVCAWDLLDMKAGAAGLATTDSTKPKSSTKFRAQTQAHTHWINDIVLAQNNTALVSASSDLTVKVWRPHSETQKDAITIGEHADYVKCVATPPHDPSANWVASGGLDRKICLWDLNGGGKTLEIDNKGEVAEKGSIYALSVAPRIIASGGPESSVRLWDPRTGDAVTKFVGHTDNVRSILLNEAGDTVMTSSSDSTIKLWSITAGRCMYTFTMHNDSVWSLYSDDPTLGIFYSSDRSGMVAKTDVRGTLEDMDDGLSLAIAQEHGNISKILAADGYIWTATSTSSINKWPDVDTSSDIKLPEAYRRHRSASGSTARPRQVSPPPAAESTDKKEENKEIPAKSILKISNTATFPKQVARDPDAAIGGNAAARKGSEIAPDSTSHGPEPLFHLPRETIEGQFGLVKHKLLNDRRRVLTLDTAGDVLLWDLIRCEVIQSYGKRHLEDVEPEVNTREAVAPWCSIDTSSGSLTVVLEPFNCFDAEMYADDLAPGEAVDFRDDQRKDRRCPPSGPAHLDRDAAQYIWGGRGPRDLQRHRVLMARSGRRPPGLAIGMATPGARLQDVPEGAATPASPLEKRTSHANRTSVENGDYFSSTIAPADGASKGGQTPATPSEPAASDVKSPGAENGKEKEKDANGKAPSTPFGKKKFRMGMGSMSFGSKKIERSASTSTEKPAVVDEKAEESESSSTHEKEVDDSFLGVVQRIRNEYEKQLTDSPDKIVETGITPSLYNDTPVLKLPSGTKVFIQEETSGSSANLYQGTVETVGQDVDVIEQRGPMWLGEVLLQNQIPPKDPVKVSFVLVPWENSLPDLAATDGNNRLNANRMLRVKKILSYVAERIEPPVTEPDPNALRPDEYLELYCNDMKLPNTMTLATLRAHVWKGGNDITLHYKANGRKVIENPIPTPQAAAPVEPEAAPVEPEAAPAEAGVNGADGSAAPLTPAPTTTPAATTTAPTTAAA
ncbi:WD repeat-containing protein [Verticillium alfalfae VaMs.102]|uniref:WD repeat-containing protein n=1 Tax=Verticillium alfalfae (strain VaMs.102 / ATCC MYA-4576 / FGSC 10136) TaxID=526221 RepID=C9SFB9_VERA1|nr:WD repeat-containing protein [Verticillium alfalfae VaMs.102]EEY17905.1 WD repeat-containing protein [Verticillium alfalfae VaMs.102]